MTSMRKWITLVAIAVVVTGGLSSCSNKATEEQMKTLRELDQSRDALKIDLDRAMQTLRDAQGKLAAQDRELADCNQQTAAVKEGLAMWPNVWPDAADWNPPPPPPAPEPKKRTRK